MRYFGGAVIALLLLAAALALIPIFLIWAMLEWILGDWL